MHRLIVEVHVRAANQERRLVLLLKKVLSDAPEEIESTGDASIASKGDESLREVAFDLRFTDALKVHHPDIELL